MRIIFVLLFMVSSVFADELTNNMYKSVAIGMSVNQALVRLTGYSVQEPHSREDCYMLSPAKGEQGPWLMIIDGHIARIWMNAFNSRDVKTDKGIGIGSSKADVLAAYPNAKVYLNHYSHPELDGDDIKEDIRVDVSDDIGIIFYSFRDTVNEYFISSQASMGLAEGCS